MKQTYIFKSILDSRSLKIEYKQWLFSPKIHIHVKYGKQYGELLRPSRRPLIPDQEPLLRSYKYIDGKRGKKKISYLLRDSLREKKKRYLKSSTYYSFQTLRSQKVAKSPISPKVDFSYSLLTWRYNRMPLLSLSWTFWEAANFRLLSIMGKTVHFGGTCGKSMGRPR